MFQKQEVNAFKDFFDGGEFTYGEQPPAVRDKDIARAQSEALIAFPKNLFDDSAEETIAFHYLTAHLLLQNMQAKTGSMGSPMLLVASQSADGLSVSYSVPPELQNSPYFSAFLSTYFGTKYALMVYPIARANARGIAPGATTP